MSLPVAIGRLRMSAAFLGDISSVSRILKNETDGLDCDQEGWTPLQYIKHS